MKKNTGQQKKTTKKKKNTAKKVLLFFIVSGSLSPIIGNAETPPSGNRSQATIIVRPKESSSDTGSTSSINSSTTDTKSSSLSSTSETTMSSVSDSSSTTSSTAKPIGTKPTGKLPSTGETSSHILFYMGIFVVMCATVFYMNFKKKEGTNL